MDAQPRGSGGEREKRECTLCHHEFASVLPYYCKRCSHILYYGASELKSRQQEREALAREVEGLLTHRAPEMQVAMEASVARARVQRKREELEQCKEERAVARDALHERQVAVDLLERRVTAMRTIQEAEDGAVTMEVLVEMRKDAENALRARKLELVSQLYGLLPVHPTMDGKVRVVSCDVPINEDYAAMPFDMAAAAVEYLVKITRLLSTYLECPLLNRMERREGFRWAIMARWNGVPPEPSWQPLHPRASNTEAFRAGLGLLAQNVVRLCFDQGLLVRRGYESQIAQNLFRLITSKDIKQDGKVGIGSIGPYDAWVLIPEHEDEEFVFVKSTGPP